MPSYLLRNSLAVRNGANEIEYLETAQWGERLDQCLQRTVAVNLSRLLPSDGIHVAEGGRDHAETHVLLNVQQFDVDTVGHGTLIAQWQITRAGTNTPFKSGQIQLTHTGASPYSNPQAIAVTLSDLAADFSRDLAQSLRQATASGQ